MIIILQPSLFVQGSMEMAGQIRSQTDEFGFQFAKCQNDKINKFIYMDIRLSRQSRRFQPNQQPNPQCALFSMGLIADNAVHRRRSFSRRKSNASSKSESKGHLRLLKHKDPVQGSAKTNSVQQISQISQIIPKRIMTQNISKPLPKATSNNHCVPPVKSSGTEYFHGSWGIPKYAKFQGPVRETKILTQAQIQIPNIRLFDQISSNPTIQATPIIKKQSWLKKESSDNWNVSKFMNSTNASKNQELLWSSSAKLAESSRPLASSAHSLTLFTNFPTTSRTVTNNLLKPIANLDDAREVNTVFSGSHVHSRHSREPSQARTNKSIRNLNESLVIANDANQDGFWS